MGTSKGMLTLAELAALAQSGVVDTVVLGFTDLYGRLMGKRLDVDFFLEDPGAGTHACDYLLTVDMEMAPVPGYTFANWEKGYGDVHLVPDFGTLRLASWLPRTALVLCDVHGHEGLLELAPRSLLRGQMAAMAELGFTARAASELEYYLFEASYREAAQRGYRDLRPGGWYLEDYHLQQGARQEGFHGAARRHLRDSGVPVETSKGEWGLGQHELNIRHAEILDMADRHVVFKQSLKELAESQGLAVTFMAKQAEDQAGSSCHVHLSLWREGANAFHGEGRIGGLACSDTFRHFLAGWMAHLPELMPFYAPTVNSYKRFQSGSWAPTRLAWSLDNRTAGFRVVGEGKSLRIECRVPGADANPYLVYAAALASGLDGIRNRLEPPPPFQGDAYGAKELPEVPRTLNEALACFQESAFARSAFGSPVVDHYARFFRAEQAAYDRAVTDWERRRYFERI